MGSFAHPLTFRPARVKPLQKALVVIDDPQVGAAITDLLAELDYVAWVAANAHTALALSEEVSFDLTLADVGLTGGFGGVSLAAELRRRHVDMGIIILVDPLDTFPDGVEDFVTFRKPEPKLGGWYDALRLKRH